MKKDIPFSLSVQKEMQKHRIHAESEVNKSMNELGIRTLLNRAGIEKEKGYPTISLLFMLIVLPLIQQSLCSLWSGKYFEGKLQAHKDTYYRFLNQVRFNWRRFVLMLSTRIIARTDTTPLKEKTIIVDDSLLKKTGEEMELVSYHHDHTTNRTQLGYQMLQIGYHNGTRFYPLDIAFHTSKRRPNEKIREIDKRTCGWKRRMESFKKKTDLTIEMIRRCSQAGISARFVLFDSWFAFDKLISEILMIGYGVICRLKRNQTPYLYEGKPMTLRELWRKVARDQLRWIGSWQIKAAIVEVDLPQAGKVSVVFVQWSKKNWHAFLCTEAEMEIAEILDYYSRRWAVEVYFRDCKQLLGLGKGQSATFDAVVARASIVMVRYLLLVYILAKRQLKGPIGPLFRELAFEHLQIAMMKSFWDRFRQVVSLSSQLFSSDSEIEKIIYLTDLIGDSTFDHQLNSCAKL